MPYPYAHALLGAVAACFLTSAAAAGPVFLKIGDIEGEATDAGHEDWIVIESVSFPTASPDGEFWFEGLRPGAAQDAKPRLRAPSRQVDRASPQLSQASNSGKAKVEMHRPLAKGTPLMVVAGRFSDCKPGQIHDAVRIRSDDGEWLLTDARVEGCAKTMATSGDADDRPTEEVAFYYNKIAFSYAKRDPVIKGSKINEN
ncbi:type VI secretion system tube protein Hcp [Sphingomicrobium marinum]|uniref:type VI secretion system tube protein Hcp n=1 Tax=Sphingomicrobium marinum TaxID=1227950 RepID=UPI0022400C88|nr:type VI secretion system tube protein Hcp [Sphingomicrobium marinum]